MPIIIAGNISGHCFNFPNVICIFGLTRALASLLLPPLMIVLIVGLHERKQDLLSHLWEELSGS